VRAGFDVFAVKYDPKPDSGLASLLTASASGLSGAAAAQLAAALRRGVVSQGGAMEGAAGLDGLLRELSGKSETDRMRLLAEDTNLLLQSMPLEVRLELAQTLANLE
jgi:hypothetical protein